MRRQRRPIIVGWHWVDGVRRAKCDIPPDPDYVLGPYDSLQWCAGCGKFSPSLTEMSNPGLLCRWCHAYRGEHRIL